MSKHITSRRIFLKSGALWAAPMAAAAVPVMALAKDRADDDMSARLRRLEDEAAIRELHQSWVGQINAGAGLPLTGGTAIRVSADHTGAAERIAIAADGRATGRFDCAVELEMPLPPDSTLAQMAHAQGSGSLRTSERRVLTVEYVKVAGTWRIDKVTSQVA
jgi:hypothetical protein